jgi:hypothetical protein
MTIILVLALLVLLGVVFGADSRDGKDWRSLPPGFRW